MRVTIIKDDGVIGINGVFKSVDLTELPAGIRAVQWDSEESRGHVEYADYSPNFDLISFADFQWALDAWNMPPQLPQEPAPTYSEMIAAAQARINAAYEKDVRAIYTGYPEEEIRSWAKQEADARAWLANNSTPTPWIDAAAVARGITKLALVDKIIENADLFAPAHGALTGKRQKLRDAIDALGAEPTQAQLDAIQW